MFSLICVCLYPYLHLYLRLCIYFSNQQNIQVVAICLNASAKVGEAMDAAINLEHDGPPTPSRKEEKAHNQRKLCYVVLAVTEPADANSTPSRSPQILDKHWKMRARPKYKSRI